MIVHRKKEGIEDALDAAGVREAPVRVLNEVLLPAMKEVGDKFGAGELILPFVLQSAEVMKRAVRHLEQFLERQEGYTKGRVVLATVYGDVHDIGKSLVNTILSNNGYTVFDLGKQVPVNTIIEKAVEVNADAIGLSALLVSTSKQMPLCVQELDRRGMRIPVLIGGAAINRRFGRRALFVEGERAYDSGVFYCKDAFEGLETMDALPMATPGRGSSRRVIDEARADVFLHAAVGKDMPGGTAGTVRSSVSQTIPFRPPVLRRARRCATSRWTRCSTCSTSTSCTGCSGEGAARATYEAMVRDVFEPTRNRLQGRGAARRLARAAGRLRLLPRAIGRERPGGLRSGRLRERRRRPSRDRALSLSRGRRGASGSCLADYFRSVESGDVDVAAFQVVTVGDAATRRFEELQAGANTRKPTTRTASRSRPPRPSPSGCTAGCGASSASPPTGASATRGATAPVPTSTTTRVVFRLLPAADALGMQLTSAFQLVPEQSTAAIIVHHPEAQYYAVRGQAGEGADVRTAEPPDRDSPVPTPREGAGTATATADGISTGNSAA